MGYSGDNGLGDFLLMMQGNDPETHRLLELPAQAFRNGTPARADSFNAKPGPREITPMTPTNGLLIPPDLLAKMPLEQRVKPEQSMRHIP